MNQIEQEIEKVNKTLYWPETVGASMLPVNQTKFTHIRVSEMIPAENYIRMQPMLEDVDNLIAFDASDYKDIKMLGNIATEYITQNADKFKQIRAMLLD